MKAVSMNGFIGVSADEWEGWPRIAQLMSEGRNMEAIGCSKEDHPKFWEVAAAYATEMVHAREEKNRRGEIGTPVAIAPR
jgi:hypothetical protein